MLTTRLCEQLEIQHPVLLGGTGLGTNPRLVAAVSNAGGLGIQGCGGRAPVQIAELARQIRDATDRPFGMNLLLFRTDVAQLDAVLEARPAVLSTAWARGDQPLDGVVIAAHLAGVAVMHMVSTVQEAERAAEAGVDVIVAQGTEGGGHVGLIGTMVLVPAVVRAVSPVPVVAAGGLADGAGLAAALVLGAEGGLYGTRFLATTEASISATYKEAIVRCDDHGTVLTELPDVANAMGWPGAYARVQRNGFIATWPGREGELRRVQPSLAQALQRAFETGDADGGLLYSGQSAALIHTIEPAAEVLWRIVDDAVEILNGRALSLVAPAPAR
jgi:NAD(P)H-dependent flavin oxidoreductase YrpB (nitropropane dioxygenase family)